MFIMKKGEVVEELSEQQIKELTIAEAKKRGLRPLTLSNLSIYDFRADYEVKLETQLNIELKGFEFLYKDKIHGIHIPELKLPKNSVIAIVGHNGAGKSTFARCLCGLERKCKGMLLMKQQSMGTKQRIRNCYMVMQDVNHQLFTESVLDEVVLSMTDKHMTQEDKQVKAMQILKALDLESVSEEHPMALSGGQKQRVAVASAVASQRELIIFDEPTSGLDYEHMRQVARMIQKLKAMGKTVFVITHDLEFILSCCRDILYLEDGKVVEQYQLTRQSEAKLLHLFMHK
jgi:energy-coupling factor transport system ATP-binding protein